jgi:hypothetical protein
MPARASDVSTPGAPRLPPEARQPSPEVRGSSPEARGSSPEAPWRAGWLAYPLALAFGLLLAWYTFPLDFVWPLQPGLQGGDGAQHAIGQRYFLAEPWGWPLLYARGLEAPYGVNIAFTDSIPLLALPLKLVAAWLPPGFHGIGLWYALAWVSQPVAAVFCIRATGERRLPAVLAFMLLACAMPAWWARFGHAALTGHVVLLLALGLYFRLVRGEDGIPWRGWLAAAVLMACTLLLHPYMLLMVAGTLGAAPATLVVRRMAGQGGQRWGWAVLGFGCCVVLVSAMGALLSYGGASLPNYLYGRFAMNLFSPVWPTKSGMLPAAWRPGYADATGESGWEGYNWLGFGVLGGLLLGLAFSPRAAGRGLYRHAGLVAALLALTLLALSFQIGAGGRIVAKLGKAPEFIMQFRASGRLFWSVAYALALAAVLLLARIRAVVPRNGLLAAVALVQWVDVGPHRAAVAVHLADFRRPAGPEVAWMRGNMRGVAEVAVLPRWMCIHYEPGGNAAMQERLMQLVGVASESATPVNTMYLARLSRPIDCNADLRAAAAPLQPGELRVLLKPGLHQGLVPGGAALCQAVGQVAFCRAGGTLVAGRPASYGMEAGGAGLALLRDGWHPPEALGSWSAEEEALLALPVAPEGMGQRLALTVQGYARKIGGVRDVSVRLDGRPVAEWRLEDGRPTRLQLDLPAGGRMLTFVVDRPARPVRRDAGSRDGRRLGLALMSLEVLP